ncbi:MAG: PEP-CTERM sorting domain-containing protein [Opitutales bacterium]|nr:PEP-CTERM sorting domain-containing protein [Opitutales bacterium]
MNKNILSALAASFAALPGLSSQVAIESFNSPIQQSFSSFVGTEASLPSGWSFGGSGNDPIFRGVFNSSANAAGDFTGVMAATNGTSGNSIAWRESTGGANLGDFRLIFAVTNNTGAPITAFDFSYDLETWVNGRRDNELRFKYDVFIDPADAGRATFETDILARDSADTRNPNHTAIASNGEQFVLDGSLAGNRTTVSGTIDLTTLLVDEGDPAAGVFGPLGVGQTAFFRWQISNNQLTDGNRSALGINNFELTAIPEPSTYAAIAGFLALGLVWWRRRKS